MHYFGVAATIQVGPNSVAARLQFKYVGSFVQADEGQDKGALCSAGQAFRSLQATLLSSRRVGLGSKLRFSTSPWCCPGSCTLYGASESWVLTEAQGAQPRDLPICLGLHRDPNGSSTAELLATTGQARTADLTRRHRV